MSVARMKCATASAAAAAPTLTLSGGERYPSELVSLWHESRFTDIAVCAEGVECKAHRLVLASSSGYFRSLFDSGMSDAADTVHSLEGMRAPVLKAVLAFVYEGSCEIEESQLTDLLDASARLMVEPLKAACAATMAAQLSPDSALEVWRIAEAFSLLALEKAAVESALGGFEELPPQLASGSQVLALVQEERLVAKNEEAVFMWIARWWEAAERPEAELMAVLMHVRFATMAEGFLRDTVRAWPALLSEEGQGVLQTSLTPGVGGVQPLRRLGFGPRRVYLMGEGEAEAVSTVWAYDPALDSWCEVASMAAKRFGHAAAALDGKLYVMGVMTEFQFQDAPAQMTEPQVYDPEADDWQPLPNMPTDRDRLAVAAVGGKVYAIGGCIGECVTCDAVEAYDPLSGAWTRVASLSVARGGHTATVVEGKIYVLGGTTYDDPTYGEESERGIGEQSSDRVDMYDPANDSWQQMAAMPTARGSHAAAVLDGKIYVSGGKCRRESTAAEELAYLDDMFDLSDALEAYDPVADTWTVLASLSQAREQHASAVVNGKLRVFGGRLSLPDHTRDRISTDLVEVYSPTSNSWARAADLPCAICESVAVAL
eukprot:scaffold117233_cov69-Phaeocystis_antarctica.AAC.1